jgi:hypothetical protein
MATTSANANEVRQRTVDHNVNFDHALESYVLVVIGVHVRLIKPVACYNSNNLVH